jgi:hypothetical protein
MKNAHKKFNKKDYVTKNDYFYFETSKRRFIKLISLGIVRFLNNSLIKIFGLKIVKNSHIQAELTNYILDKNLDNIKLDMLSLEIQNFFSHGNLFCEISTLKKIIKNYDYIFRNSAIKNNLGGMGYNSGLVTYIFLSTIKPEIVYESGVWRGFTTALIDKATTNDCRILCFDISFKNLFYKSEKALYFESDISENDLSKFSKSISAALFDDHVSHLERLVWCQKNKIKFAIFDDDVSPLSIHSDGWPPVPTLNMLFNYENIPKVFEWVSINRKGKADISGISTNPLFTNYHYLQIPDLFSFTGYRNTSETSFIIAK